RVQLRLRRGPVMMPHARVELRLSELRALLGRENGTDLLQDFHAQRNRLTEELLHLARLGRDGAGVAAVERELTEVGLRGAQRLPRLLLLVTMSLEGRLDGGHLVVGEPQALLHARHTVRARRGSRLPLRGGLSERGAGAGEKSHE